MAKTIFSHQQYQSKYSLRSHGWSYTTGYEIDYDTNVYPIRGVAVNKENELKLRLQLNVNDLVNSVEKTNGFPVSLKLFNSGFN